MGSNKEKRQQIYDYLQQKEVQERIWKNMEKARTGATVTTSRAAKLFSMGEQQLRDWEKRGLIQAERAPTTSSQAGKQTTGHRQFTLDELDKLALVKELIDAGVCSFGEIPPDLLHIWQKIKDAEEQAAVDAQKYTSEIDIPFEERFARARKKLFWRFFAAHALRFAALLIAEGMPGESVTLVLPLSNRDRVVEHINDVPALGESLVGWLTRSGSSQTSLVPRLVFAYATDYRVQALRIMKSNEPQETTPQDSTVVILRRAARPLTLTTEVVETIRLLLKPLYDHSEEIRSCLGLDSYDVIDAAPDLRNSAVYPDLILNALADMIVELGCTIDQHSHWRFCCILLPSDPSLPLQQQVLSVQAQSQHSPHKIGISVSPEKDLNSLSLRAYQSGQVSYRNKITPDDSILAYKDEEHPVNAAIALPVGGEDGEPIGVIYVASEFEQAFTNVRDRRVLRLVSRMASELIKIYQIRRKEAEGLGSILRLPDVVDELQGDFPSENAFIDDLEEFLIAFKRQLGERNRLAPEEGTSDQVQESRQPVDSLSLIGIDVDHLGSYTMRYGNRAIHNLIREIGLRIKGDLGSTFKKYPGCQYYHIYADRFYVLLKYVPYDQVLSNARFLKKSLDGSYKIRILDKMGTQPPPSGTLVELAITTRLAVSSYHEKTLEEILERYPSEASINSVREMIERSLVGELKKGMAEGGNRIRAWNPEARVYSTLLKGDM